ncbi:hypothetical protein ONS95_003753 [Cadophora gregata]|uniref:uncharacterized protein n=1 Tax=Cadophora gregata TaxID=51156 RepID=UPI0026DB9A70|nr:uncharacterized protein ONS95_003753 [Cadophora gregata]KAK0107042.1 hypothetical protein ONS95_003753 [Cadophora gregata]
MQYTAVAVLALAATASAAYKNETVSYTTEVVTDYVTYCPVATTLTYGHVTYTAKESETVTIPGTYTVVKPVTTSSAVAPTYTPVYPTANATTVAPVPTTYPAGTAAPTVAPTATPAPSPITANGAGKTMALSGASLAGLVGLAAFLL